MDSRILKSLVDMAHAPIRNYAIPGLTSWLIAPRSEKGCIRLFTMEREHEEAIVPHSHRFDFQCYVLEGWVTNTIWTPGNEGDLYHSTILHYAGEPGAYTVEDGCSTTFSKKSTRYYTGDRYDMAQDDIHTINFSRGAKVLFFEGPQITDSSLVLQPVVEGYGVVPTFKVQAWMFK